MAAQLAAQAVVDVLAHPIADDLPPKLELRNIFAERMAPANPAVKIRAHAEPLRAYWSQELQEEEDSASQRIKKRC